MTGNSLSWDDGVQFCPDGGAETLSHSGDGGRAEEEEREGGDDALGVGDERRGREGGEMVKDDHCLGRTGLDSLQN